MYIFALVFILCMSYICGRKAVPAPSRRMGGPLRKHTPHLKPTTMKTTAITHTGGTPSETAPPRAGTGRARMGVVAPAAAALRGAWDRAAGSGGRRYRCSAHGWPCCAIVGGCGEKRAAGYGGIGRFGAAPRKEEMGCPPRTGRVPGCAEGKWGAGEGERAERMRRRAIAGLRYCGGLRSVCGVCGGLCGQGCAFSRHFAMWLAMRCRPVRSQESKRAGSELSMSSTATTSPLTMTGTTISDFEAALQAM